ncbi:hypothetical protein Leryth_007860 [Lithospermum erythrorhizon]|nr:hypothetical protein Leryth_007860 [Lithospermum erythrorhizon]
MEGDFHVVHGWPNQEQQPSEIKIDVSKLVENVQAQNINGDGAGGSQYGSGGVGDPFGTQNRQCDPPGEHQRKGTLYLVPLRRKH